jgi:hypothetical protein
MNDSDASHQAVTAPVSRLEAAVRTYEVEFRGFLNGQGHHPPLELGAVLATAFEELASEPQRQHLLGSRFASLEARFLAAQRLSNERLEQADRLQARHPWSPRQRAWSPETRDSAPLVA